MYAPSTHRIHTHTHNVCARPAAGVCLSLGRLYSEFDGCVCSARRAPSEIITTVTAAADYYSRRIAVFGIREIPGVAPFAGSSIHARGRSGYTGVDLGDV